MISKKSRKVVAALLIGATVCASGTFAYFNSKADMSDFMTNDTARQLSITNGHVVVKGNITGSETMNAYWSYGVSELSDPAVFSDETSKKQHASPDILSGGTRLETTTDEQISLASGATLERTKIGAAISDGAITRTRPGDAIVLGDGSSNDAGLEILNASNLTTKIQLRFKRVGGTVDKAKEEFAKLITAGWKFYFNGAEYTDAEALQAAIETVEYYAPALDATKPTYVEPESSTQSLADYNTANASANGKNLEDAEFVQLKVDWQAYNTAVANSKVKTFTLRLELPLTTDNTQQDQSLGGASGIKFDMNDLFEVVATQENNPSWSTDGASNNV